MEALLPASTTDIIVSAAERLFAEHGYDRASVRKMTQLAKVNLAAVNYHYGDKESLYVAVIMRRMEPINRARLAKLNQAEELAGDQPLPLAVVLEIMARPLFELCDGTDKGGLSIARIIGRSMADPLPVMDEIVVRQFQPTMARFGQAIRRHVPALAPEDFLWRLSFVVGAMHHTLATMHRMNELTRGICRNNDLEGALRRFVQFGADSFTQAETPPLG